MPLQSGTRLGPYEVIAAIGAGGMGEVYRARDKNLGREVAIKILPETVAHDADRLARFEREARTLASLNHPNIASIYGFERVDTVCALVMELVDGPTLADRIARGPIEEDEAVNVARQIVEALEAAHENGIVHRDLKPANIKLRPDGAVKVLDFGLAKAIEGPVVGSALSMSPTITTPAMTHAGIIMGTAAYMSPEQAKGKPADRRADIWSFGVVLAEMCTGHQLFTGETTAEVLAAVMKDEPQLTGLPARVRPIVERCLRRDPRHRWQAIGDVRIAIDEGAASAVARSVSSPWWSRAMPAWIVAGIAIMAAAAVAFTHLRETPTPQQSARFQVTAPERAIVTSFSLSPDGRYLAYASDDAARGIWVRPIDSLEARHLPGTEGVPFNPDGIFWSPDSAFIAFIAQNQLKKVALAGGPPQTLVTAPSRVRGTWARGVILFSAGLASPIQRIPEDGGTPVAVTRAAPGETHLAPQFLPDGRHFLYYVTGGKADGNGLYVNSIDGGAQPIRLLPDTTAARYSPSSAPGELGRLLFVREATLMAQPFDVQTFRLTGSARTVAQQVSQFSVSNRGSLAFMSGSSAQRRQLVWLDRGGKESASVGPPGDYGNFRLSPDRKRIAFNRNEGGNVDIWVFDMTRGVPSRITFDPSVDNLPIWSPDGRQILWPSNRKGGFDLYIKPASGAGDEQLFMKMSADNGWGTDWSRDGRFVLYQYAGEKKTADLSIAELTAGGGDQKPMPYLHTQFNEGNAVFSPDGRWVAYESDESGRQEVYVQAFPLTSEKVRISSNGGSDPQWRSDGAELFYIASDQHELMAVPVRVSAASFEPGVAKPLFAVPGNPTRRGYQPSADGNRFLVAKPVEGSGSAPLTVVLNWESGLAK